MSDKGLDDNDRKQRGTLPSDPFEDTDPVEQTPAPDAPPASGEQPRPLVTAADTLKDLLTRWQSPDVYVPTGLWQLDKMLGGGLRGGDSIALVGTAKAGKSALFGQVLYETSRNGALGIYASTEMPREEVLARWIAREMFLAASPGGSSWAVSASDVLYGKAYRGERIETVALVEEVSNRLTGAMKQIEDVGPRLIVERLQHGSTCETLLDLVRRAREQAQHDGMVVLFIDPIQRLFAHEAGMLKGSALDRTNAEENGRVGAVALQLIAMLERDKKLAVLFTSDTTKGAAREGVNSATDLRGSYLLNHAASTILGLDRMDLADLDDDERASQLRPRLDHGVLARKDAQMLGARVATVDCSGQRRGPSDGMAFTVVPGAMHFAEGIELDTHTAPIGPRAPRASGSPSERGGKKGKR
jgi:replicative DNA helicase